MAIGVYTHKSKPVADRFWPKVDKRGPDDCWLWTGRAVAHFGYGRMSMPPKKQARAHRVSWEIHNGPIPENLTVLHKCDNPPCCNPNHLFLGTKKDNTRDMIAKGRMIPPPHAYGDAHHKVTIQDAEIPAIRDSKETARVLSAKYKVSLATIYKIKRGLTRCNSGQMFMVKGIRLKGN